MSADFEAFTLLNGERRMSNDELVLGLSGGGPPTQDMSSLGAMCMNVDQAHCRVFKANSDYCH